ncbi:ROK family transcriptional regulator [Terracoccus sp. 273MFTsu3.1]|uniref:ROK family transcriptional regulator n=1 Tax=Terracoccus sp. 273MFTsu3.1 TaxID=1172188 RepID=UPI0003782641|nr:ROK family transcriptional regulator [Terracoccus sp. 273MFTsu3.1]
MSSAKPSLDLLRSLTEEHVLHALMEHGRLTRAEVAARTGISKPTISEGVRRLVDAGLVVDTGERSSGRGRAGSYFTLAPDSGAALVVGITPQGVVAEAVDAFGVVVGSADVALPRDAGVGAVGLALTRAANAAAARVTGRLRLAVVSAADPVDRETGRLVHLPDAPFLVGDLDAPSLLATAVDGPVLVDNDVNWAARAERAAGGAGAVDGSHDFVYLYLDEGLGLAVVSDGEVRRGHSGLAGEIAHLTTQGPDGRATRLTEVFAQLGLRRAGSTAIDVGRLRTTIADSGRGASTLDALGAAVSGVLEAAVALVDPEKVVVGGAWGSDEAMVGELRRRSADLPRRVPVVVAAVTQQPQLVGARAEALQRLRDVIITTVRTPDPV